ncbi:winged helix-turn-helix domain-containing protein [Burkholderiaceae bacterium DAT-1]|nr:winged helix-turn-helix domain-containing protein [Burkholderiaceae bacterium DAT-1]
MSDVIRYRYVFGPACLDEMTAELSVNGLLVDVQPQSLRLLCALLSRHGELVSRETLEHEVWQGRLVGENVLAAAITRLRNALGPSLTGFIESIPRMGYRLTLPVEKIPVQQQAVQLLHLSENTPVPGNEHFTLLRKLSSSHMSEVWLAQHRSSRLNRVFKFAFDPIQIAALKREVTLSRLLKQSTNEPQRFLDVIDWRFDEQLNYIQFEWGGVSLDQWLNSDHCLDTLSEADRLTLLSDIVAAVAEAHAVGVVHRDVKPGNILVLEENGERIVRLCDFGSGRALDTDIFAALDLTIVAGGQTQDFMTDTQSGSMFYLAPECLQGVPASERSDVYALGVLMYQMLSGRLGQPLVTGWERDIEDAILRQDIADCTDGDVARRLDHAGSVLRRLRSVETRRTEQSERIAAQTAHAEAREVIRRQRARRPWKIASLVILLAGLTASGVAYYRLAKSQAALERESSNFKALNTFWSIDFLDAANPGTAGRYKVTVEEALGKAAENLDKPERGYSPEIRFLMHESLAYAFSDIDLLDKAAAQGEKALALSRSLANRDLEHERRIEMAMVGYLVNLSRIQEASQRLDQMNAGGDIEKWPVTESSRYWVFRAQLAEREARWSVAKTAYQRALPLLEKIDDLNAISRDSNIWLVRSSIAETTKLEGDVDSAAQQYKTLLSEYAQKRGKKYLTYCNLKVVYAGTLREQNKFEQAIREIEEALTCLKDVQAAGSVWEAQARRSLGETYYLADKFTEATAQLRVAAEIFGRMVGPLADETINAEVTLARSIGFMGDVAGAAHRLQSLLALAAKSGEEGLPRLRYLRFYAIDLALRANQVADQAKHLQHLDIEELNRFEVDPAWEARLQMTWGRYWLLKHDSRARATLERALSLYQKQDPDNKTAHEEIRVLLAKAAH